MSEATVTFALSRETVTMSPRLPVLPDTLMRSCRNFSCETIGRGEIGGGQAKGLRTIVSRSVWLALCPVP
eukprot:scaffold31621_cov33-Phaeocystis_antarctica.AAC.1